MWIYYWLASWNTVIDIVMEATENRGMGVAFVGDSVTNPNIFIESRAKIIEWTNWPHQDRINGNAVISVLQTPDVNFEPCPFDAYYIVRHGGPLPSRAKGTYPWVTPSLMSWTCTTRRTTRSLPLHGVSLSRIPRLLQRFVPLAAGHLRGVEEELRDTLDWCAHGRSCLPV